MRIVIDTDDLWWRFKRWLKHSVFRMPYPPPNDGLVYDCLKMELDEVVNTPIDDGFPFTKDFDDE